MARKVSETEREAARAELRVAERELLNDPSILDTQVARIKRLVHQGEMPEELARLAVEHLRTVAGDLQGDLA